MAHTTDLDLTAKEVTELASPDAITAFLAKLGYDTADRTVLSPEAVGLSSESAIAIGPRTRSSFFGLCSPSRSR